MRGDKKPSLDAEKTERIAAHCFRFCVWCYCLVLLGLAVLGGFVIFGDVLAGVAYRMGVG